jgi:tetratricopeptide (TPR) repeat protein
VSFEQALALASSSDRSPADVAALRSKLALAMRLDGDEDEGLELLRAAHEELRQELGDLHPGVVNSLANLGHVLARANRFAEARPVLERALELRERIHGPTALSNTRLLGVLAQLDRAQGDVSAASARLRRIEDIEDRWLAPDDPERAENSLARAEVALDLGDDAAAERILAISRARFETTLPAGHPYHFGTLRVRARLARHRGHPAAATALLVEAVALAERHGLPNEEMATVLYIEAAEAAAASGDEGAARMWAIAAAASSPTASATLRDRIAALLAE